MLFGSPKGILICGACIELCEDILAEELGASA